MVLVVVVLMAAVVEGGAPAAGAGARPVAGRVETVTLYRGQALVTRAVPVEAPAGRVELVVADLPQRVVPDSLFAEGGAGIEVRAVRFRTRAVGEEPREEVRKLDLRIEEVQSKIAHNKKMQQVVAQRVAFLEKLDGFTAPTAKAELTKGVLNFETLEKLAFFSFKQRQAVADDSLKLEGEACDLAKQLSLLQRQRSNLTRGASRTVREAVLFLEKRGAAKAGVKLSYLVSQAGWSPAYNFRAGGAGKEFRIEYNATIQQMSGEDWNTVALTLSTASPVLSAEGPGLAPFRVVLSKTPGKAPRSQRELAVRFRSIRGRLRLAHGRQQAAAQLRDSRDFNWKMNTAANDMQCLELTAGRDALELIQREPAADAEGPSVSYRLAAPVSLASRSDQQMLRVTDMKLASRFYHVASPVLTSYVYRQAELKNTDAEVLLGGAVSVYLDGRFVGRGEIPTVAKGQTFVMGFGADPQLRARRELVHKSEAVRGGNREVTLKYRLTLENYKGAAASVRLFDRIPIAERRADIRVTLGEMTDKLSEDKLYLRLERPKGILRWDIEVPARAAGETARIAQYGYTLEFERSLHLKAPVEGKLKEWQEEFEQMQELRFFH